MVVLALISLLIAGAALGLAVFERRERLASAPLVLNGLPEDVPGLRADVAAMRSEVAALAVENSRNLQHIAIVRYDAFGDVGGQLSWSLVIADGDGDGLLLTSIHGRTEGRSYAKALRAWECSATLSPQEEAALAQAKPIGQ